MTCPHALTIPWGRDDEAHQCKLDDGPCDEIRAGCCGELGREEENAVVDSPVTVQRYRRPGSGG